MPGVMKLTDHEQKLLLRALDKASAPAEAEKAAQTLIASLRNRGISGYDILDGTAPADTANPVYRTQAWCKKAKEDWYRDYVNRGPNDPPRGVDPDGWRCAWERRDPTPEEAARMDVRQAWEDWLFSDDDTPRPPNTGSRRHNGNGSNATPPPQLDRKWNFVREQRQNPQPQPAPQPVAHSSKVASAIGIGIITFICFFLAFTVSHNMLVAAIVGGLVLRGLRRVNFLGN